MFLQSAAVHLDPHLSTSFFVDLGLSRRERLLRTLRRQFPGTCQGRIEDAFASALMAAVEHPERFRAAWTSGGADRVHGLFRVIAWRRLRGVHRRKSSTSEIGVAHLSDFPRGQPAGQEIAVAARRRLAGMVDASVAASGAKDEDKVRAALSDKLSSGDPDTVVAVRRGVRREYLNRAKNHLHTEVFGPDGLL